MIHLQYIRKILESDNNIQQFIRRTYWEYCTIRYANVWFIVIPLGGKVVMKYYFSSDYLSDVWVSCNFHLREKANFHILQKKGICTPLYDYKWEIKIWNNRFYYAEIENIRLNYSKMESFLQIEPEKLALFCNILHKDSYIHWNIHPSNFFLNHGQIGIFDLLDYWLWAREKDLSRILLNSSNAYMNSFLESYIFPYNTYEIYKYALDELLSNYKLGYWDRLIIKEQIKQIQVLIQIYDWD